MVALKRVHPLVHGLLDVPVQLLVVVGSRLGRYCSRRETGGQRLRGKVAVAAEMTGRVVRGIDRGSGGRRARRLGGLAMGLECPLLLGGEAGEGEVDRLDIASLYLLWLRGTVSSPCLGLRRQ